MKDSPAPIKTKLYARLDLKYATVMEKARPLERVGGVGRSVASDDYFTLHILVDLDETRVINVCNCLLEKQVGGLMVLSFPEIFILLFLRVIIAY